jgi:hypothetical protein
MAGEHEKAPVCGENMSSLKDKAKTYDEIKDEQKWLAEHGRRLEVKWVKLKDAQKEIDLANKDFKEQYKEAERLSNLLRNAENEHLILKQKLQESIEEIKHFYGFECQACIILKNKFEELLKEKEPI